MSEMAMLRQLTNADSVANNARRMASAFHNTTKGCIALAVFLSVAGAQVVPLSRPTIVYRTMKIPAGAQVYIGPPAKPIPKQLSDAIGTELGKIPDVLEAHLLMVYMKGQIDPPAQVLVVVLEENKPSPQAKMTEVLVRAKLSRQRSRVRVSSSPPFFSGSYRT